LPPAFSINALTVPDRSDGLLTSPFTPEWEYDAYVMNNGILLLPVLSVHSGRGIFHDLIELTALRGRKNGFVDTSSITYW